MYEYKAIVVKVVDGDTVDVDIDLGFNVWLKKQRIRLYGIDSQYFWDEDEIEIALKCNDCKTNKQRRLYFISSLVHEYRHWVQCHIEKVSEKKLNYSEEDIAERSDNYTKNKYELECAEWEKLVEKFDNFLS